MYPRIGAVVVMHEKVNNPTLLYAEDGAPLTISG